MKSFFSSLKFSFSEYLNEELSVLGVKKKWNVWIITYLMSVHCFLKFIKCLTGEAGYMMQNVSYAWHMKV